jgi:hypothetical protein
MSPAEVQDSPEASSHSVTGGAPGRNRTCCLAVRRRGQTILQVSIRIPTRSVRYQVLLPLYMAVATCLATRQVVAIVASPRSPKPMQTRRLRRIIGETGPQAGWLQSVVCEL